VPETDVASGPLKLTVETSDSQTQILVLDSRSRLLKRGMGPTHDFTLDPGIYRVKVLTGAETHETVVVLREQQTVKFDPARFVSPMPLAGTSSSHEYHMEAANEQSRKTHVKVGTGSSLFFFVRHWTPSGRGGTPLHLDESPAAGLSLFAVDAQGERKLCELTAGEDKLDLPDPCAACTVEVDPGVYELRLELPSGETLHQTFVASPGWQTQAFLFLRPYRSLGETSAPSAWRADLTRTSVHLTRGSGFAPDEPMLRIAELARVSLATRRSSASSETDRRLVPDDLRALLLGKFQDPMLGIYGAHLLLLESAVDLSHLAVAVTALRTMLGEEHPDVEALALRAGVSRALARSANPRRCVAVGRCSSTPVSLIQVSS